MRMAKGKPFMDVKADFVPEECRDEHTELPVFCESFLYPTVGKGDARFILGVAEEYAHIIEALGTKAVRRILVTRPRLVQRLGVGDSVSEQLADALSSEEEYREQQFPDVTLDHEDAGTLWRMLHDEYRRYYDPEKSMDSDHLRLYHKLTDALGSYEQGERQKEIDRLPEKLEKQRAKIAKREADEAARREATC